MIAFSVTDTGLIGFLGPENGGITSVTRSQARGINRSTWGAPSVKYDQDAGFQMTVSEMRSLVSPNLCICKKPEYAGGSLGAILYCCTTRSTTSGQERSWLEWSRSESWRKLRLWLLVADNPTLLPAPELRWKQPPTAGSREHGGMKEKDLHTMIRKTSRHDASC